MNEPIAYPIVYLCLLKGEVRGIMQSESDADFWATLGPRRWVDAYAVVPDGWAIRRNVKQTYSKKKTKSIET
jgi:hypothetical protein